MIETNSPSTSLRFVMSAPCCAHMPTRAHSYMCDIDVPYRSIFRVIVTLENNLEVAVNVSLVVFRWRKERIES